MPGRPQFASVEEYLASLPSDRRDEIERVRRVVKQNLPAGYVEGVGFGMICYSVPLNEYADTWSTRSIRAWEEGWWMMPLTVGDLIGRISQPLHLCL